MNCGAADAAPDVFFSNSVTTSQGRTAAVCSFIAAHLKLHECSVMSTLYHPLFLITQ